MAQQDKTKTISSVSDILGFVLEQSELPPEKRTPIKRDDEAEIQAESEYVSTLVDALAHPGTFVSKEILGTIQSLVDPELEIQTSRDRIGSVKMKASDVPSFLENPDAFVDKLFDSRKNMSQMEKVRWAGEQMKMLAGSTYAKKMNLFDNYSPEMKSVMERALGQSSMGTKQVADLNWMASASNRILKEGHLSKRYSYLKSAVESDSITAQQKRQYEAEIARLEGSALKGGTDAVKGFRYLLQEEFKSARSDILRGRNVEELSEEEFKQYSNSLEAENMIKLWNQYPSSRNVRKLRNEIKDKKQALDKHKEAIEKGGVFREGGRRYDYSQLSDKERKERLRDIRKGMRDLRSADISLQRRAFWTGAGKLEGAYYGIRNTLSSGGIEAVLNGDFYDPKKGYLGCPSIKDGSKTFDGAKIKFVKADNERPDGGKKSQIVRGYNDAMVNLYYYNPMNIMKSFVTGEFFAWQADKMRDKLKDMWGVSEGDFTNLKDPKFWNFYKKYKKLDTEGRAKLLASGEYTEYSRMMNRLGKYFGNKDTKLGKKLAEAERLAKRSELMAQFAKFFSTPTRMLNWFQDHTIGAIQKSVRNSTVGLLSKFKGFAKNDAARELLEAWGAGAGGKALSKAIASAIIGTASALTGPLTVMLSGVISVGVEKLTMISTKIFIFAFFGIFGLFVLVIGTMGTSKKQTRVDAYSREIPGTVYYNYEDSFDYGNTDFDNEMDGEYHDPVNPDEDWEDDGSSPDTPNECVQGEDLQDVYKRARDFVSSTYGNVNTSMYYTYPGEQWYEYGEEWWWCISTSSGIYCRADKITTGSCSYVYNLFVHELIHQLQGSCTKYMKEWGADYLSQNAGGYRFSTSRGCVRATELTTSSCTPEQKIDAALCKNTSNSCFQDISNRISGFCN